MEIRDTYYNAWHERTNKDFVVIFIERRITVSGNLDMSGDANLAIIDNRYPFLKMKAGELVRAVEGPFNTLYFPEYRVLVVEKFRNIITTWRNFYLFISCSPSYTWHVMTTEKIPRKAKSFRNVITYTGVP